MKVRNVCVSAAVAVLTLTATAHAATKFSIRLDSDQEVAPAGSTNSQGTGEGTAVIQQTDAGLELRFDLVFDATHDFRPIFGGGDLQDPVRLVDATFGDPNGQSGNDVTRLHIHNAGLGANGPVVFGLINPLMDLDGDVQVRRKLTGETRIFGAWDVGEGAGFENFAEELLALGAGDAAPLYFNLHTADDPAGALRGQFIATNNNAAVPIPGALPLMAAGLAGIAASRRKARAKN